jgi:hypothetical protein
MKKNLKSLILILIIIIITRCTEKQINTNQTFVNQTETVKDEIQNGDIIFQTSLSQQSKAIQLATKSKFSHCGIIYKKENKWMVFEAVQPVKLTLLETWINSGEEQKYVIKRLKNAKGLLNESILKKMKLEGEKMMGKNYDTTFEWSDNRIYCSELIWKIYDRALGIQLGKLEKLGDLDLSHDIVKKILTKRYGKNIPKDEIVISPGSIFNSNLLETIKSN